MLRNMKAKALALLTALAMTLGLGAVATAPAYAAGSDGSIAVTGNDGFQGIAVYQMFNEEGEGETAKYVLNDAWKSFFTTDAGQGGIGLTDGDDFSDAAYMYVKNLGVNDAQAVSDFAKKAAAWAAVSSHNISATNSAKVSAGSKTATVDKLAYGYYLVVPNPKGSTDQTNPFRGTDAMLVNVNSGKLVEMELKTVYPTVDKKVEDNANHASASVGDTLDFTLTSKVPDISEYTQGYQFSFVDTLSKGLTFNESSVVVKINGTAVQATDYHVSTAGQTFTINFGKPGSGLLDGKYDATSLFTGKAGQTITVTYTATLNENAVVADGKDDATDADNINTVKVVYSNNPDTNGTGESGESKTHQYTFGFDLKKTDGTHPLAGAKFQLKNSSGVINLISTGTDNTYRPAKADEMDDDSVTTEVTTPEGGVIHFTGLAAGTYTLVETEAPDGYNKAADTTVTIEATYNNENGTLESWSVKVGDQDQADQTVEVVNHAGTLLPGTGGIGTVIFTVAGLVLVVAGVAWAMRRRQRD